MADWEFEKQKWREGYTRVVGIDEAGRGPLAGPVVTGACLLPKDFDVPGVNDSKKLTEKQRERIYSLLTTHSEVEWAIGIADARLIDEINILQATIYAMREAAEKLSPDFLLVDGLSLGDRSEKIIKGDQRSLSIAAASIIAKVTRDEMMRKAHLRWPEYGFAKHKGYGTKLHLEALREHGPCEIHRMTFAPVALAKKIKVGEN